MNNRKHYLDNLRTFTILLLFPFHIFEIYNGQGSGFYVTGEPLLIPEIFNAIVSFWMMPLLFAVAGISSRYALSKRSAGGYIKERVSKLLLPFIFGVLLIIPVQSYIAGLHHNGGAGYFDSFTKVTDLSGFDGAFALGHLWFLIFLFVISIVSLPFMLWYKSKGKGTLGDKAPLILIILMGLLPCIGSMLKIGIGKSPTEDLAYFMLGYFFLSNDKLLERLDKYRFLLLEAAALYSAITAFVLNWEFYEMASWLWILALLGIGNHYLNFNGKATTYLSSSSFGIYIFHQSWIVIVTFFIFKVIDNPVLQIPAIFITSVVLTYLTYEICRRFGLTRFMFALKNNVRQ